MAECLLLHTARRDCNIFMFNQIFQDDLSGIWGPARIHPGPFSSSVHINDLPKNLNTHSIIYVDDTILLSDHENVICLQQIGQQAKTMFYDKFSTNKLSYNTEKTQYII
jgi:hypothetical protein